jgi:hypothetical protein
MITVDEDKFKKTTVMVVCDLPRGKHTKHDLKRWVVGSKGLGFSLR